MFKSLSIKVIGLNVLVFIIALLYSEASASETKDRSSVHSIQLGFMRTQAYNEYASILPYQGYQFGLLYEGNRAMQIPLTRQQWRIQAEGGPLLSPSKSRQHYSARLHFHWGMYTEVLNTKGFNINIGGQLGLDNRILYFPSYSNSSIQFGSNISADFTANFAYSFSIKKFPMRISYNLAVPIIGVGFSPEFGASYYEIVGIEGGFKDVLSCFSLHNYANIQNEFGIDFIFSKCTMRLSYVGYSLWTKNKGVYQEWHSHGVELGFVINMLNNSGRK